MNPLTEQQDWFVRPIQNRLERQRTGLFRVLEKHPLQPLSHSIRASKIVAGGALVLSRKLFSSHRVPAH